MKLPVKELIKFHLTIEQQQDYIMLHCMSKDKPNTLEDFLEDSAKEKENLATQAMEAENFFQKLRINVENDRIRIQLVLSPIKNSEKSTWYIDFSLKCCNTRMFK